MLRYVHRAGVGVISWRQAGTATVDATLAPRDNHRKVVSRGRVVRVADGYAATGATYTLTAESGSFALTGQDAGLAFNRVLVADTNSFALTGQDVTLTYTGNGYTYTLSAESGSFALAGQDATLSKTGGGLRRYKHYRKGYLKRGNEVLVFDSEELAEQYEAAEIEAAQAINRAQRRKARIAIPKPAAKVDIAQVEIQAAAYQMPANVPNMVAALDYEQLVMLTQRIADMQDEEDLELLLL